MRKVIIAVLALITGCAFVLSVNSASAQDGMVPCPEFLTIPLPDLPTSNCVPVSPTPRANSGKCTRERTACNSAIRPLRSSNRRIVTCNNRNERYAQQMDRAETSFMDCTNRIVQRLEQARMSAAEAVAVCQTFDPSQDISAQLDLMNAANFWCSPQNPMDQIEGAVEGLVDRIEDQIGDAISAWVDVALGQCRPVIGGVCGLLGDPDCFLVSGMSGDSIPRVIDPVNCSDTCESAVIGCANRIRQERIQNAERGRLACRLVRRLITGMNVYYTKVRSCHTTLNRAQVRIKRTQYRGYSKALRDQCTASNAHIKSENACTHANRGECSYGIEIPNVEFLVTP